MEKNATSKQSQISKLLLLLLLLFTGVIFGQSTANYTFSTVSNGSLTDMSSGTTTILTPTTTTADVASTAQNIGFNFVFMGTVYTQFSVNSNGLMRFGSTPVATTFTNSLATSTDIPFLAPFWDDLNNASDQATNFTSKVIMKVTGSVPNRVLTVEWKDFAIIYNGSTATALSTFQVRLYEATGVIEYAYGRMQIAPSSGTVTASIGFTNTNADNGLLSVTSISTPAVSTLAAGVVNNLVNSSSVGDITDLNSTSDGSRKVYTFTPPAAPDAPSGLNFTSVGLSGMTLNWTDNSAGELGFAIYRSDDGGTTYNYITKANADAVSYAATGLAPGTNYYWQVAALSEGKQSTTANGNQATATPTLSGTKTVGTGENYETLTAALTDITNNGLAGAIILELTSNFSGSGETLPIVLSNFPGLSVTNTLTIRPALGVTGRSISTSEANSIISFDGGRYITIDGRPGGTGSDREFTISNSANGPTIRFINDASNNIIKYCNIVGSNNTLNSSNVPTSGVVLFGTTSNTTGSDNNTIDYCNINALGSAVGIMSNGTSGKENSGNTISNNTIRNFYISNTSLVSTYGIRLTTGSTEFTITGNSLYQEAARAYSSTAVIHYMISCSNTSGNSFLVTNNHMGGDSPNSAGTYTISSGQARLFVLEVSVGTATPSSVQGNTIRNIDLTTAFAGSGSSGFIGIFVSAGAVNIGNLSGNTIGSNSATNSIVYNNTGSDAGILFLGANLASTGTVVFNNNIIGGLTANVTTSTVRINLYGLTTSSTGQLTVSGNTIGSTTVPNSILNNAGNTTTNFNLRGINSTSTNANVVFSNNTVANISMTSTNTGPSLVGMYFGPSSASTGYTVTGNSVYNLTTASSRTSTGSTAPLIGIAFVNGSGGGVHNFSGNTIHSLSNTTGTAATDIYGLYISNATSTVSTVANNFIHSFKHASSGICRIMGIYNVNCALNIYNNMVRLGIDKDGSSVTGGYWIAGIWKETTQRNSIMHNSVYIGGADVTSTPNQSTFAFRKSGTGTTDSLLNNIFFNARSNGTGTGKHYAIYVNNTTTFVSNNNVFYVNGTGGVLGYNGTTDQTTLSGWQITTSKDGNSGFGDPNYILPAGTSATLNLHVQSPTPIEGTGTAIAYITNDFDGDDRSAFTPVDIGADAGNFTALDIFTPVITYTALNNTASTSNRTQTSVTITDATGVPTSGSLQPRIWFRKSSGTPSDWASTQGSLQSGSGTNGVWNFTIDYSQIPVTPAAGETYQYYVVAQDGAVTPNIATNPLGGSHTDVNSQVSAPVTPNSYNIVTAYSGNYDVPGAYATLTGAGGMFEALNGGVLTANVTITITGDITEAGTNGLNQWLEEGAGSYTVTIQPSEAVVKNITGAVAQAMIRLNGCDRVTIDGRIAEDGRYLLFRNTNTSNSTINIQSDASNNVIRNCVIEGVNTTATQGVLFITPGTTYVTGNDNNMIRGNQIKDGATVPANLIYSAGYSTTVRNSGNIIFDNELFNFTSTGIFLATTNSGNENFTVIGNTIYQGAGRTTALYGMQLNTLNTANMVSQNIIRDLNTSSTAYGIYIDDVGTVDVTKNRIYNFPSTNGSTSALIGIYIWGATNGISNIYNNQISIIPSFTNAQTVHGIRDYANGGDISNIYYNSVYIGGTGSGTSKSYAFDDNSTSTFDILRNNLFINARTGGSGGHFAARSAGTASITDMNSNYNFYAGNGPTLGNNFELSSTAKSFTEWKAAFTGSGKDVNSWSVNTSDINPANLFYNVATGDLDINNNNTDCWLVNGKGIVAFGCADDFNGAGVRSTITGIPTDIGSDEFNTGTTPPVISINTPSAGANSIVQNGATLGTITFAPVEATLPTALEIQYFPGQDPPAPLTGNYSKAYWSITATGGEGYSYDLTLNYDPAQIGTITSEDNIKLAKRNAGVWSHLSASVVNTTNKTVTMTGLTSFSEFALSDNLSPLPVELDAFTSVVKGRDVTLNWSTKTEVSSNRFVVERSLSSNSLWEKVGEVKASGNSNSPKEYSLTDKKLNSGKYSYRLKMIDNDGTFDYSDVIDAEIEIPKEFALNQNYPNPFNPSTVISYQLPIDSKVTLELYAITGEKVATLVNDVQTAGYYNLPFTINNSQLSSGVYIYRLVAGEFVNTKKMVVLK